MFILYAIPIGLIVGWLRGGRLETLGNLPFRWAPVAIAGLLAQVLLFSTPVGGALGDAVPVVYIATTAIVLGVVLANRAVPGMKLVALGAASNLAAILANRGYMPADPDALATAGMSAAEGPTNSIVATNPALAPLTDVFALPAGLPFANVFSIGDVLIAVGIAWAIGRGMSGSWGRDDAPSGHVAAPQGGEPGPVRGGTSPD